MNIAIEQYYIQFNFTMHIADIPTDTRRKKYCILSIQK